MTSIAYGAAVEWNLDKKGRLNGSGCNSQAQDTFLIEAGEQFAVIFTKLHARLDEGELRKAEATCSGTIPIAVHQDRYLDRIEQTLAYSWSKSLGTTALIKASNKWYGRALSPLHVNVQASQEGVEAYAEVFSTDDLKWGCKPNDIKKGNLDLDFLVSVKRNHPAEEAIDVNLSGHDMRYTALTVWKNCPN
jgi:hypothetical protein